MASLINKENIIKEMKEGYGLNCWVIGNRCYRCGHKWIPRNSKIKPKNCPNPKCKSPYWFTPRIADIERGKKNGK